jgi:toxin ParE1/3/4
MTKRVSLHELAELELNDAADFYDSKQPGLGRSFILDVQQSVVQIREHPESANVVRGSARRKILRQFPYNIIYSLTLEDNSYSRDC